MPEQDLKDFIKLKRGEQVKIKPQIEDIINIHLDGDIRKNILDIVAYLRENNMPLKWYSHNGWAAKYKGGIICQIILTFGTYLTHSWIVIPNLIHRKEYEDQIISEGLQDFILDNIFYCVHDPKSPWSGKGCDPNKRCAPRGAVTTIVGKEVYGMCRCRPNPIIGDPNTTAISGIKKLIELEQKAFQNK